MIRAYDGVTENTARAHARYRDLITELFLKADIVIDGTRPFDIRVTNSSFYGRVLRDGALGIGEAYMDGWWECDSIEEMTSRFIQADLQKESFKNFKLLLYAIRVRLSNRGGRSKIFEVGQRHYDLGNELFRLMLDKRMIYSCGDWKAATNLDEAQENKLDLICKRIGLKSGMRLLDIGCGWGGLARFAAENYGAEVVGITVSKEQLKYASQLCSDLPVELRLQDYRDLQGKFDRIISIEMIEAVGHKYYRRFMKTVDRCLKPGGYFLLQAIVGNEHVSPSEAPWLNKYIFPNGESPSLAQITKSVEKLFIVEAFYKFERDYEKTLNAWYQNFLEGWPEIQDAYDERFFRMWKFYLLISRGIFLSRKAQVWQIVFSKNKMGSSLQNV